MRSSHCIVLTGGPCGGKSTLLKELHELDPSIERWIGVPEAASLLLLSGLTAGNKPFQKAVLRLQMAMEDVFAEVAGTGRAILCDRGTLDCLAYWRLNRWDEQEFFDFTGMTLRQHYERYYGVIHLQTTAIGRVCDYTRWPQAIRRESPDEAAEVDAYIAGVWAEHPRYALIDNAYPDWAAKSEAARQVVHEWIGAIRGM